MMQFHSVGANYQKSYPTKENYLVVQSCVIPSHSAWIRTQHHDNGNVAMGVLNISPISLMSRIMKEENVTRELWLSVSG
jgi:hypothetical protein